MDKEATGESDNLGSLEPGQVAWPKAARRGKYNAKKAVHGGRLYHSAREADYARELDIRVLAGELKSWRRQVPIRLVVNGNLICKYVLDFVEENPDGSETWTEVKGYETPEWRLKWKLFEALYPERRKQIVR